MSRLPGYHAKPSPFPPRTGFALAFDDAIDELSKLRARQVVAESCNEDSPRDLRALVELLKDTARAVDPLFQRIAHKAGLTSMSGASLYVGVVSNYALDDLLGEIEARAAKIEDERGGESLATADRRENGTMSHACQGIAR
jgi:hypothetical protein